MTWVQWRQTYVIIIVTVATPAADVNSEDIQIKYLKYSYQFMWYLFMTTSEVYSSYTASECH